MPSLMIEWVRPIPSRSRPPKIDRECLLGEHHRVAGLDANDPCRNGYVLDLPQRDRQGGEHIRLLCELGGPDGTRNPSCARNVRASTYASTKRPVAHIRQRMEEGYDFRRAEHRNCTLSAQVMHPFGWTLMPSQPTSPVRNHPSTKAVALADSGR
jgi:hypothetical protein